METPFILQTHSQFFFCFVFSSCLDFQHIPAITSARFIECKNKWLAGRKINVKWHKKYTKYHNPAMCSTIASSNLNNRKSLPLAQITDPFTFICIVFIILFARCCVCAVLRRTLSIWVKFEILRSRDFSLSLLFVFFFCSHCSFSSAYNRSFYLVWFSIENDVFQFLVLISFLKTNFYCELAHVTDWWGTL